MESRQTIKQPNQEIGHPLNRHPPNIVISEWRISINLDYFISGNPFSWIAGHPAGWTYLLFSIFPNGWMSIQILKEIFFVLKSNFSGNF